MTHPTHSETLERERKWEITKLEYSSPNSDVDIGEMYYWANYWHEQWQASRAAQPVAGVDVAFQAIDMRRTDDCFSACLASVLGLPSDKVPYFFGLPHEDEVQWWQHVRDFLRPFNLGVINATTNEVDLRRIKGFLLVSGISARGIMHCVVWKDGKMLHDPHPERGGIEKPLEIDILYVLEPYKQTALSNPAPQVGEDVK